MTPTEILIAAREKIEHGWTQKTYARSEGGDSVAYNSQDAVCWCSIGAICAVDSSLSSAVDRATKILAETIEINPSRLTEWNDAPDRTQDDAPDRTQDEVLIAFGWAIEASMEDRAERSRVSKGES